MSSAISAKMNRLRIVSMVEGTTLVVLLFIAVPLKHMMDLPAAVSIMGPIHGVAFLLYLWMVFKTVSTETWHKGEIARMVIVAFIPFGAFLNAPFMRRKEKELKTLAPASSAK
ncbi:DUF3817 domain-containing protein [Phytohalomonas tamaricis]|uniref:DUF3817 domain-containing protein n=1 Tax=Phytohalomonas tamaricis TaxID=2081032 RepID=UPI0021D44E3B|nr:DUF3817 domain-containing protein [Phytohalomonas tamaricis]